MGHFRFLPLGCRMTFLRHCVLLILLKVLLKGSPKLAFIQPPGRIWSCEIMVDYVLLSIFTWVFLRCLMFLFVCFVFLQFSGALKLILHLFTIYHWCHKVWRTLHLQLFIKTVFGHHCLFKKKKLIKQNIIRLTV